MDELIGIALLLMLTGTAVMVGMQRNLFASTMLMSIFSLLSASLFLCLDAVDVAFTEAAVGAGIATLLFLSVLTLTEAQERFRSMRRFPALCLAVLCGACLLYGLHDMPVLGDPQAPVHTVLSPRYLQGTAEEIGIQNAVTAVLASYRGYDTFGEVVVIFTALIGVLMLLGRGGAAEKGSDAERGAG